MVRLGIVGMDAVFSNKARILLRGIATVYRIGEDESFSPEEYDALFTDAASKYAGEPRFVTFGDGGDFPLPCPHETIVKALTAVNRQSAERPLLYLDGRCARLGEKEIMLTNKEAMLLGILLGGKDKGVTNGEICNMLPLEFGDYNSLKVYVNYLRKKLEAGGDKIIFSTRIPGGCKYAIHDKYWRVH